MFHVQSSMFNLFRTFPSLLTSTPTKPLFSGETGLSCLSLMSSSLDPITQTTQHGEAFARPVAEAIGIPELLAPAGDWKCAKAAVENGADAIYFGLEKFNARMRAHNFTESDLPQLMEFLHRRGVKG